VEKYLHIENSGTIGAIGDQATLNQSFNSIATSGADESVKALLRELLDLSMTVGSALPAEQGQQLLADTNTFVEEATKPKPRRGILAAVGGALSDLARQANEVGGPFVDLVEKVTRLFS
jgi:hypothetical protein